MDGSRHLKMIYGAFLGTMIDISKIQTETCLNELRIMKWYDAHFSESWTSQKPG